MTPESDRVGVMITRIWIEPSAGSLRARMMWTLDVSASSEQESRAAASTDQVVAAVREWIEAFLAHAP